MDPMNIYLLGKIRQQEILESCQRDQQGVAVKGQAASLLQRVIALLSARHERPRTPQAVVCVEYSDGFAPSR